MPDPAFSSGLFLAVPHESLFASSAICGTDLHIYEGRMGDVAGMVIGHEPLGVVEEVGSAVVSVRRGDRVTIPTHICCGFCFNCLRGYTDACLTVHPGSAGGAYGYPGMGPYRGAQTELVRVPFADANCLRLPGEPGDNWEHDFVLLADAFPTGYHATELAQVSPGNSVAIFGAGAIGLLAAYCALELRGAGEVYVVDNIPARLEKAGEIGAVPIDFGRGDPAEQILERRSRARRAGGVTWRGEEAMNGVDCGIDAIGFQARVFTDSGREDPGAVIHALARLINPTGHLGIAGVFLAHDARPVGELAAAGDVAIPWGELFRKDVTIGMGRDHDERYNAYLRDLIIAGRVKPSVVVSNRLPLADRPRPSADAMSAWTATSRSSSTRPAGRLGGNPSARVGEDDVLLHGVPCSVDVSELFACTVSYIAGPPTSPERAAAVCPFGRCHAGCHRSVLRSGAKTEERAIMEIVTSERALESPRVPRREGARAVPVLRAERLTRYIDGVAIVQDISFEVLAGDVLAVIGPSGSGKSSLLRLLNRLDEPTRGTVFVAGIDYRRVPPRELRRRIGLVPQAPALFPGTVADNVRFGPRQRGIELAAADVGRLLGQIGLGGYETRNVATLSGGEAQRVALARTLANEPDALLLDEPTSALDEDAKQQVQESIEAMIRSRSLTCVVVTHDAELAARLGRRVMVISHGRVERTGTVREVLHA